MSQTDSNPGSLGVSSSEIQRSVSAQPSLLSSGSSLSPIPSPSTSLDSLGSMALIVVSLLIFPHILYGLPVAVKEVQNKLVEGNQKGKNRKKRIRNTKRHSIFLRDKSNKLEASKRFLFWAEIFPKKMM